jgi:hypothetical protein
MILDKEGVIREPLYLNNNHEFTKYIYISYNKNHFSVITSMRALTRMDFYCDLCKKGFHRSDTHHCAKTCHSCKRLNCAKDLRNMRCTQCKIYYNNETCLRLHDSHFCKAKTTCKDCGNKKMYYHVCGDNQKWCNVCKKSVPLAVHQCFIQKEKIEET